MSAGSRPGTAAGELRGRRGAVTIRRTVNDQIAILATRFDAAGDSEFQFVCECGDLRCREVISLTLSAYGATSPGSVLGGH